MTKQTLVPQIRASAWKCVRKSEQLKGDTALTNKIFEREIPAQVIGAGKSPILRASKITDLFS